MTRKSPQPANENPWYILMTLHGEQTGDSIDRDLAKKNRLFWNAWIGRSLSSQHIARLNSHKIIDTSEFYQWRNYEGDFAKLIGERIGADAGLFEEPKIDDDIDIENCIFSNMLVVDGYLFTNFNSQYAHFQRDFSAVGCDFMESCTLSGAYFECDASFKSTWFESDSDFARARFGGTCGFQNCKFFRRADFRECNFRGVTDYRSALMGGVSNFSSCTFVDQVNFTDVIFHDDFTSRKTDFMEDCFFSRVVFHGEAVFAGSIFSGSTHFEEADFIGAAIFDKISTKAGLFLNGAVFLAVIEMRHSVLDGPVRFVGAKFLAKRGVAQNCVDLSYSKFGSTMSMFRARFKYTYPELDGIVSNVPIQVSSGDKYWPNDSVLFYSYFGNGERRRQAAMSERQKLSQLRHWMTRQDLPEDAHFFYRREMYYSTRIGEFFSRVPTYLYGVVSRFGDSIIRPFASLVLLWAFGCAVYASSGAFSFGRSASFSFAAMFKFLGLQRTYFDAEMVRSLPIELQIVSAGQTVLAFVLIFFLGLGLRTRFRLR